MAGSANNSIPPIMQSRFKELLKEAPQLHGYGYIVGIDWADSKHDICLVDLRSQTSEQFVLKHQVADLSAFVERLRSKSQEGGRVAVVIDQKRGALINFLLDLEFIDIFPLHTNKLDLFRQAIYPSGRKNDVIDSELFVEYFLKHGHHLGDPLKLDKAEVRELGFLLEDRRSIVDERTKCVQQIGAALKQYYPLALELFDDLSSSMACRFLEKWPTFESLKRARETTLRNFFYGNNSRSTKKIEERIQAIKEAQSLTSDPAVINASSRKVSRLAKEILTKNPDILAYNKRIKELYKMQEEAKIFESLPGAGEVMEPRLMAVFGTDRERFETAQNVTEYTGVAPVTRESGFSRKSQRKTRVVNFRIGAPKFLRQSLVEYAGSSVQYCPWAKAYYAMKQDQGQKRQTILRGLAIKWVRVIFECWKRNQPYSEERYIEALKRSGSPICAQMEKMGIQA